MTITERIIKIADTFPEEQRVLVVIKISEQIEGLRLEAKIEKLREIEKQIKK